MKKSEKGTVVIKKGFPKPYDGLTEAERRKILKLIFDQKYGKKDEES